MCLSADFVSYFFMVSRLRKIDRCLYACIIYMYIYIYIYIYIHIYIYVYKTRGAVAKSSQKQRYRRRNYVSQAVSQNCQVLE